MKKIEGEGKYCTIERCNEIQHKVDLEMSVLRSLISEESIRYQNLKDWLIRIEGKQNWILGVLITLLLTIISLLGYIALVGIRVG